MSLYDAWTRYDAWMAFANNVCKYVAPGGAKTTPSECEEIKKAAICLCKLKPPIFWHDLHTDGEPDTSVAVMRLRRFLQARYKALDGPRCLACQMALAVAKCMARCGDGVASSAVARLVTFAARNENADCPPRSACTVCCVDIRPATTTTERLAVAKEIDALLPNMQMAKLVGDQRYHMVSVGSTLVEGVRRRSASALAVPRVAQCLDSLYLQVRLAGQPTRGTTTQRKSGAQRCDSARCKSWPSRCDQLFAHAHALRLRSRSASFSSWFRHYYYYYYYYYGLDLHYHHRFKCYSPAGRFGKSTTHAGGVTAQGLSTL